MSDPKLFETDGPTEHVNPYDSKQVYDKMMKTEGMEFGFQIEATNPDPQRTFSQEALDVIRNNMGLWVGTRIVRHFKERGRGAKKMQVHVLVSLDGEAPQVTSSVPFISFPDSQHKLKSRKK